MKVRLLAIIILCIVTSPLSMVKAQWAFDVPSVEAYINDHKQQRSLLLARATLEQSNRALHSLTSEAAVDYKNLNFDLDRYTRAFDVIDVLYQSLRTGMNAYDTYETVSSRIQDYRRMLDEFADKIIARNKLELGDKIILLIAQRCIQDIYTESRTLYNSLSDLVLYSTGAAACSTADLLAVINNINLSLDNIKAHLNRAYFDTWRYIQVRIGYWKAEVYRKKGVPAIADEAFRRWRDSGLNLWRVKE